MVIWCSKISEFSSEPSWHMFFTVVQTLTVNQLIVNQHTEPIILERRQKLQKEAAVLTSYIKHNQDSIHTLMMICQRSVHRVKGQGQRQKFKRFNMQNSEQYSMYNIWMCSWYIERRTDESVKLNKFWGQRSKTTVDYKIFTKFRTLIQLYHVRVPMAYWETNVRMTYCDQDY